MRCSPVSKTTLLVALAALALLPAMATPVMAQGRGGRGAGGRGGGPAGRPPLFFSMTWAQSAEGGEHPVSQQSVSNSNLELKLYGATEEEILINGDGSTGANPIHVWNGTCPAGCAVTFRHNQSNVNLSGLARIQWNTKTSGFHKVQPVVKLADGTWLVGDHASGSTADYLVDDFSLSDVRWLTLDIDRVVTTGNWVANPDLSNVEEVGFVDLLPGSGHGAGGWIDVAEIEVYGTPVARN